jgi:PIN domain nuclease of toxin-antitoxin system
LSIASVWELQIKNQLGKLVLDQPLEEIVREQVDKNGLQVLSIDLTHVLGLNTLPLHHRDPFDRILIAQARTEGITLLTCDPVIREYEVPVVW